MRKIWVLLGLLGAVLLLVSSNGASVTGIGGLQAEIFTLGQSMGRFAVASSPSFEVEVLEVADPMSPWVTKAPGKIRFSPIVLEMGVGPMNPLVLWWQTVQQSTTMPIPATEVKRDGTISLYDDTGTKIGEYAFQGGWPSRLVGFDVSRSGYVGRVTELLELRVDRIDRIPSGGAGEGGQ